MVFRVFTEKKPGFDPAAQTLLQEIRQFLHISALENVRILQRYDVEGLSRTSFEACISTVFSNPQTDIVCENMPLGADKTLSVALLPGQYDQQADTAALCAQIVAQSEKPTVRGAKVYLLYGKLSETDCEKIENHLINPVECRRAGEKLPETLAETTPTPEDVPVLEGFIALDATGLAQVHGAYNLAMDEADLAFLQQYFQSENRNPTETELRVLDTYWSDHCRHTTFLTDLSVEIEDETVAAAYRRYLALRRETGRENRPETLMDMATIGAKALQSRGLLPNLDESEEINACTVKINVSEDGEEKPWLLLFKNETHNHPTEIEPFGGAATCLGGAIRDPLSGRGYAYQAMRVSGAANPAAPGETTRQGKLPQRRIATAAAAGFADYGNQIGLATGQVHELYHPGYEAKRMEAGAVMAAVPAENVRREKPLPGDVVLLLGGKTGRDGCGGATGSSKSHDSSSLEESGAEVQKGNPPEERKIVRLFRNKAATCLIKRCNDFGAGGVSVAIGELADGLAIQLDAVPTKYQGLNGTELAISESQERMAVVVAPEDVETLTALAREENLDATPVAVVTAERRMTMRWQGKVIADLHRDFLNANGAARQAKAHIAPLPPLQVQAKGEGFAATMGAVASDLSVCSQRGLGEGFDSTIGAATVLMPYGGKYQKTPEQTMAALLPTTGETDDCTAMAFGCDPWLLAQNPYAGAYLAVLESVLKLYAAGFPQNDMYLSLQEYFPRLGKDPSRWGLPAAALLGALDAQMDLELAAIGGKDSMSGSFEELDVPPTLISFAVAKGKAISVVSGTMQQAGSRLWLLKPAEEGGLPCRESMQTCLQTLQTLHGKGAVRSASIPGRFGPAERIFKMCLGNHLGFAFADAAKDLIFAHIPGGILVETAAETEVIGGICLGVVTEKPSLTLQNEEISLTELENISSSVLESVYPTACAERRSIPPKISFAGEKASPYQGAALHLQKPLALVPLFPGTNGEYDGEKALRAAGFAVKTLPLHSQTAADVAHSAQRLAENIRKAQLVFLPAGFAGGAPDNRGKFIAAYLRHDAVAEGLSHLLQTQDGLLAGIGSGFQALLRLGLLPFGAITDCGKAGAFLTQNNIGRHQAKLARVRIASASSPWFSAYAPGEVVMAPISTGEGRFVCSGECLESLAEKGQIAAQFATATGMPSYSTADNPTGSDWAVAALTSPCGRILGTLGHFERLGSLLYQNVPGQQAANILAGAFRYFK